MKNYLNLMQRILDYGDIKGSARCLLPRTKELFGEILKFNLQDGFPLLTTKRIYTKGVIEELLFFLRGSTDVTELIKKNVNIWNEDTYQFYLKQLDKKKGEIFMSYNEWFQLGKSDKHDESTYDMGKIYSYHWREWGRHFINNETGNEVIVDQVLNLVNSIIKKPNSRYSIISAWNPTIIQTGDAALPSCHVLFQTNIREGKYLDLSIYQRSADFFLGVPFNISSYAFLIHILCELSGYKPGILTWIGGSVHIYENHVDSCEEQLKRETRDLPTLFINTEKIDKFIDIGKKDGYTSGLLDVIFKNLTFEDFKIENYNPQPTIKGVLSTGLNEDNYELKWGQTA